MSYTDIIIRLAMSILIGGGVGFERSIIGRPAGFRTHALVCLGSTLVMMTGTYISQIYGTDPSRMAAQVVSGIGFLGAGTIIRVGLSVKGLTTAATLWAVACLGITVGGGFYAASIIATLFLLLTLTVFSKMEQRLTHNATNVANFSIKSTDKAVVHKISAIGKRYKAYIHDIKISGDEENAYDLDLKFIPITKSINFIRYEELLLELSDIPEIITISYSYA